MPAVNELVVVDGKRLGKLKPAFDPARLSLHRFTDVSQLPAAPAEWDQTSLVADLGMMLNNSLGDCTCAEAGHAIQFWTALASSLVTVPDPAVEALYEAVGGYVPGDPSTDNGAVISAVLAYLKSTGIDGHKIGAFASVPLDDTALWDQVAWLWGGLNAGWALPIATQSMGSTWDIPAGQSLTGDWAAGSWGGHCTLYGASYDANGNRKTASWGEWITVTQAFASAYLEELWVAVSPDWIEANGTSPDGGFNTDQLDADLNDIAQNPNAGPIPVPHEGFIERVLHEGEEIIEDVEHLIHRDC